MGAVNASVGIAASPERVWDVIVTPATYERWLTIHTKWKGEIPETFTEGAQAAEVVTMLGMANTITWSVEELDAPVRLRISGTGMAGVETAFTLEVASDGNGGSMVTIDAEFKGQMIAGALGKAVERDAKDNLEKSLAKLGELVA